MRRAEPRSDEGVSGNDCSPLVVHDRITSSERFMDTAGAAFDAFLRKPVDFDNLCGTIRSVVHRGQQSA
jgi:hypothetical protein